MPSDPAKYLAVVEAESGKTIYVNPNAVRFVFPAGHRTVLVFSETHNVTVTADLPSLMDSGLFQL